jgi:N-acetylneuraminic acid mutarotase
LEINFSTSKRRIAMKKSFLLTSFFIFIFVATTFSQYNMWIYKSAMPTAKTFLSSCAFDNNLYVIGGCPSPNATNKVDVYNPSTDTWSSVSNLPAARCYAMSCIFQNKIYVFGGSQGMYDDAVKSVYVFDPQTGTWSQKADMPYAIICGGIAVVDDTIYLVGGALNVTTPPVVTVMGYDPITETWTQKADLLTARCALSACVVNGKIYAIGGGAPDYNNVFYKVVEVYDPATNTWTQKSDMPTGRWGLITLVLDSLIYAIGGRAGSSCTKNEVYNLATDVWSTKAPMLQPRNGLAGGVINNNIYVAGGHKGPPLVYLSSCEEYTPDLSDVESGFNLLPQKIELMQNYPNPFNPSTKISWQLPVGSQATLKVYDMLGREVATLVNVNKPAGKYEVEFSAAGLPSGIYFYRLQSGSFVETKKMILLR